MRFPQALNLQVEVEIPLFTLHGLFLHLIRGYFSNSYFLTDKDAFPSFFEVIQFDTPFPLAPHLYS